MGSITLTTAQLNTLLALLDFDGSKMVDCPINEITDPSAASAPDPITLSRGGFNFRFDAYDCANTTEWKTYRVEIPHDALISAGLGVHFRATPTTDGTGDVRMIIEYALQKKAGNIVNGGTKESVKTILANGNTNGTEYYFSFPLTTTDTGLSTMARGDSLFINIKREPTNAADTYAADIAQIEFGVHVGVGYIGEDA